MDAAPATAPTLESWVAAVCRDPAAHVAFLDWLDEQAHPLASRARELAAECLRDCGGSFGGRVVSIGDLGGYWFDGALHFRMKFLSLFRRPCGACCRRASQTGETFPGFGYQTTATSDGRVRTTIAPSFADCPECGGKGWVLKQTPPAT